LVSRTYRAGRGRFEADVFLLGKAMAEALKSGGAPKRTTTEPQPPPRDESLPPRDDGAITEPTSVSEAQTTRLRLTGNIPPEVWNRLGTKILPKLRSGSDLEIGVDFAVTVKAENAGNLAAELRQILQELGLAGTVRVE
jgi:hypothetical protein